MGGCGAAVRTNWCLGCYLVLTNFSVAHYIQWPNLDTSERIWPSPSHSSPAPLEFHLTGAPSLATPHSLQLLTNNTALLQPAASSPAVLLGLPPHWLPEYSFSNKLDHVTSLFKTYCFQGRGQITQFVNHPTNTEVRGTY